MFNLRDDLSSHMVDSHGYRRSYQCPVCNVKFTTKEDIQKHMVNNHKKPEQQKPKSLQHFPKSETLVSTNFSNKNPSQTNTEAGMDVQKLIGENHKKSDQKNPQNLQIRPILQGLKLGQGSPQPFIHLSSSFALLH